jgi:protein-L-isoaspartate(D-aspartate) O-methyltransferase
MPEPDIAALRAGLVEKLKDLGYLSKDEVGQAFLRVPREAFVPDVRLDRLYQDIAVVTRWNRAGEPTSSSSQPAIMARMLEVLDLARGQNVLEIGVGTAYNAALLQELVGQEGRVTSVDIQASVAREASDRLACAGYGRVEVLCRDGFLGVPERAPFDRVIVTTSTPDISPAWWQQLRPGGLLVVPLRLTGPQAVFAFERTEDGFVSRRYVAGGFMPMRGIMARGAFDRRLGPRRDLGVSGEYRGPRLRAEPLFRLLNTIPTEETPESIQPSNSESRAAFEEFWSLLFFLSFQPDPLIGFSTRSEVYGFTSVQGFVDARIPSAALLSLEGEGQGSDRKLGLRLRSYGSGEMRERMLASIAAFVETGRPGTLDALLEVKRRGAPVAPETVGSMQRKHWRYDLFYLEPDPDA